MFYIYILKSEINGSYYIGSSHDINARLEMHNHGLVRSTKRYIPWQIVYSEKYKNLNDARRRELQIKLWKKRSAIERLIKNNMRV